MYIGKKLRIYLTTLFIFYQIKTRHELVLNTRARVSGCKTLMKNFGWKKPFESKSHMCVNIDCGHRCHIRGIPAHNGFLLPEYYDVVWERKYGSNALQFSLSYLGIFVTRNNHMWSSKCYILLRLWKLLLCMCNTRSILVSPGTFEAQITVS